MVKQFHQYQQNEQCISPQIIEHIKTTTYKIGNPGRGLYQDVSKSENFVKQAKATIT
jgi:hypothetical protein